MYARKGIIIIILKGVDTSYTFLQGQAILGDVIPLYLVFDGNNHLLGLYFGPHVCVSPTCYASNDMFVITSLKDS